MRHIYTVGQSVCLEPVAGLHLNPLELYTVTRLLPPAGASLQYRIRSEREPYERVVAEDHIKGRWTEKNPSGT